MRIPEILIINRSSSIVLVLNNGVKQQRRKTYGAAELVYW
jgi:hypothetical protein